MARKPKKSVKSTTTKKSTKSVKSVESVTVQPKDKLLSRLTVFFFEHARITALLWIALVIFGALSYTTFMKREGFPSVDFPLTFVGGTYFVNDASKVDSDVTGPLSKLATEQPGVAAVHATASSNFFNVQIQFDEGVDAKAATKTLEQKVKDENILPDQVMAQFSAPYFGATGPSQKKIDEAISFYPFDASTSTEEIVAKANEAAAALKAKNLSNVTDVFVEDPFQQTVNPATGEAVTVQQNFDRFGIRPENKTTYYKSVIIGISAVDNVDVIKLDDQIQKALEDIRNEPQFKGYDMEVSASFAPNIKDNINELQRVLLEGFIAILIVGAIVIALRASIITVISLVTVVSITLGFLYVIGYTLNVITLFALILALALMVDDTIIMVEAIDAARHRHKDRSKVIREATTKVSRAMVAATAVAALSFAPFLFVGGILGSFIKAIPITIIAALIISLLVALIFIPFFSRYLLLGKKQMGKKGVTEVAEGFEAAIARFITRPMIWARHSHKKLFAVGGLAVLIGVGFIVAGGIIARNVTFNIFPPTKDTNGLSLSMQFPAGKTIQDAEGIAAKADKIAADTLKENFVQASYFNSGSQTGASEQIEIISYNDRKVTSPQLVTELQAKYDREFKEASVTVGQLDIGPPASSFTVQIDAADRETAFKVANDLQKFLQNEELKRPNGSTAHLTNVTVSSQNEFVRVDGKPVITVSAGFDGSDTSTLVTLAQTAVKDEFTPMAVEKYGIKPEAIKVDLGQESENQDSFKSLAIAFPFLLLAMFILLAVQFRSLLQPLLIFLAIPFSFFGIALGLDLTANAFSFFAMLGFFALLGLSLKNTILLTDFANQARRTGLPAVDAAVAALRERFRPLFATSATAVVSLIPLAIASPFWQGLAVVLIFGLLSSTLLVLTVFPYYYLGGEYLRTRIRARYFLLWLVIVIVLAVLVSKIFGLGWGLMVIPLSWLAIFFQRIYSRRLA